MKKIIIFLCITFIYITLVGSAAGQSGTTFRLLGAGGSFQAPLYQDWTNTFHVLSPNTSIKYEGITQADGRARLLAGTVDFAGADYNIFNDTDYANRPTLRLFPIFAGNVGFSYNLPSFSRSDPRLVLSREIVSKIYRGIISRWNDPELVQLQKSVYPNQTAVIINGTAVNFWDATMPNQTIRLGLRSDAALVTTVIGTGLAAADSWWKQSFGDSIQRTSRWPSNITSLPNRFMVGANLGMLGHLTTTQYSMGYHPFPYLVQFPEIRHFVMINKQGEVADPTDMDELAVVMADLTAKNLTVDKYRIVLPEIIDPPQPKSWPYSTFSYIVVDTNPELGNCQNRSEFYKWVRWSITAPTASDLARRKGYVQIPPNLAELVVERIKTSFSCMDSDSQTEVSFLVDVPYQQRGAGTAAVFGVEIVFFSTVFLGMTLYTIYVYKNSETPTLEYFFSAVFTIGSALEVAATIMWFIPPTTSDICAARVWLTALGLTLIFSSMFTRLYHLHKVYGHYRRNKLTKMQLMKRRLVFFSALIVFIALLIQVIILTLWQSIHPVFAAKIYRDNINLVTEWQCRGPGTSLGAWGIVEICFVVAMLGFGVWVILLAWNLHSHAADTRGLLISTYNIFLVICVLAPLFSVSNFDETALFYIASIVITFSVVSTAIALYWRKLIQVKKSYSSHGSGSKKASKASHTLNGSTTKKTTTSSAGSAGSAGSITSSDTGEADL